MKNPLSLAISLLLAICGAAQTPYSLARLSQVTINLKGSPTTSTTSTFRHFEIIDERPDTARIGIHAFVPTVGSTHNRQLVFRRPAAAEIADYLNTRFTQPDAPYSALIVLRGLWLSDANYLRTEKIRDPGLIHERTHIRLKVEIYAVRDSLFMPILRFDTLQAYSRDNRYTSVITYYSLWNRDVAAILRNMVDSAARLTVAKADHSQLLNINDIREFNQSRFDAPVTTGDIALTPGVYSSFEECRNNTPGQHSFDIRLEGVYRLLYINEGGSSYYSHQAWGCCDGKTIYMMRDGVLYPVWKEGKAFYFLAPPTPPALAPDGTPLAGSAYTAAARAETTQRRIYTVDMDSGKVY